MDDKQREWGKAKDANRRVNENFLLQEVCVPNIPMILCAEYSNPSAAPSLHGYFLTTEVKEVNQRGSYNFIAIAFQCDSYLPIILCVEKKLPHRQMGS